MQTEFDKTRNCGENKDWKIEADSCPHDFNNCTQSQNWTPNKRDIEAEPCLPTLNKQMDENAESLSLP